jgi:L-ascorbate metabolism protein UlaG (beta-lactamase superfamily)
MNLRLVPPVYFLIGLDIMSYRITKIILISMYMLILISGCGKVTQDTPAMAPIITSEPPTWTAIPTQSPTAAFTSTPAKPTVTPSQVLPLVINQIPRQTILQGEGFNTLNVYGFLADVEDSVEDLKWDITGSSHITATITNGVVSASAVDPAWFGFEMIKVGACTPTGRCGSQQIGFSILDGSAYRNVQVFFVGNSGFLIVVGDKKVLIDAFFDGFPPGYTLPSYVQTALMNAEPPFDNVDVILTTHDHADHFSPSMISQYMDSNQDVIFVSTSQAVSKLPDYMNRSVAMDPSSETTITTQVNGVQIHAIYISHGTPAVGEEEIYNNGYVVTIDGIKVLHTGDINRIRDIRQIGLTDQDIDLAFIPHIFLTSNIFVNLINTDLGAKYIFPIHYQYTQPEFDKNLVLTNYPKAIIFSTELESWFMPLADE